MKTYPIFIFIIFCAVHLSYGQITISPELGISYSPFQLGYGNVHDQHTAADVNRLDFIIGLSAQFPIHKQWMIDTRISYQPRSSANFETCGFLRCYQQTYKHQDFGVDLRIYRSIHPAINVGFGPSYVRKLKSEMTITNYQNTEETVVHRSQVDAFGLNMGISYAFHPIRLNLDYAYRFSAAQRIYLEKYLSRSRVSFTVAFPLNAKK